VLKKSHSKQDGQTSQPICTAPPFPPSLQMHCTRHPRMVCRSRFFFFLGGGAAGCCCSCCCCCCCCCSLAAAAASRSFLVSRLREGLVWGCCGCGVCCCCCCGGGSGGASIDGDTEVDASPPEFEPRVGSVDLCLCFVVRGVQWEGGRVGGAASGWRTPQHNCNQGCACITPTPPCQLHMNALGVYQTHCQAFHRALLLAVLGQSFRPSQIKFWLLCFES